MLPVIAEVVGVSEAFDARFQHTADGQPLVVCDVVNPGRIPIAASGDIEHIEVVASPAHRGLYRIMKSTLD
jgi:hypothetical protein